MITIIIPTRNRCETLGATLKTCVEQNHDAYRIIVSDNFSTDATREVVHSFNDRRIRYIRTPARLSMTGNFEYSLHQADPGYVGFIGDDDGLMPRAIQKVAALVASTACKAITSSSVFYAWPNYPLETSRNKALVRNLGNRVVEKDAKSEVARVIAFTGAEVNYVWGLPSIYRGFVHSDVINSAISNGRYFNSITPDAYSAFVNSLFLDKYFFLDEPLTIEGVSGKSNGASQIFGKDAKEEDQYLLENDIAFNEALVYAPSPPIILAEAYMQVCATFPRLCAARDLSIDRACRAALKYVYPGPNQTRVLDAVARIREKNRLPAYSAKEVRLRSSLSQKISHVASLLRSLEVRCGDFGAYDVHQASVLVSNLLALKKGGGTVSGAKLALEKIASRLFPT